MVGVRSARKGVLAVGIIAGVVVGAAVVLGAPGNANRYLIFPLSKDIWLTLGGSVIGGAFLSIAFVGMSAVLYCIPAIRTITRALVAPVRPYLRYGCTECLSVAVSLVFSAPRLYSGAALVGRGRPGSPPSLRSNNNAYDSWVALFSRVALCSGAQWAISYS